MGSDSVVARTKAWVEREYGREKWPQIERLIDDAIVAEGPTPELARVVRSVARHERGQDTGASTSESAVLNGVHVTVPRAAAWGAYQALIAEAVIERCTTETDLVLDLGAGWGHHLLSIWLAGGPREAVYVAAELTDAGRRAYRRLAGLAPQLRSDSIGIDLAAPDLGRVRGFTSAVVLSVHALEQVPMLSPRVFEEIRQVADSVRCVHFEPVGWQIGELDQGERRTYAERNDYNRNLYSLLCQEQDARRVIVETVVPDAVGLNPRHPTSLLAWRAPA